ncbi:unnamed protein product, partial [Vitis vinifera]
MAGSDEVNHNESKRVVPLNTWILISNFKLAYNLLRRPDGTFERELAEFLERKAPANSFPVDGVFSFDIVDKTTGLLNRVYQPAPENEAHAIYDYFCRRLVGNCKAVVVSVNYRRSPEHRYPCAYDDGWAALKWVKSRSWLQSGKDSKVHVYLAGDSSGGNITHHVAVRAAESGIEVLDRDWYWRAFLPEGEDRDHPACNPFGPRGKSLEGLNFPKSLVVVAGFDLVQDWQLAYVEGLKKAGQDVNLLFLEQATIGFYFLPNNDHFYCLMEEIKNFVKSNC